MGLLAENKSRRKISTDPNNTKWTRDTTTFGQKILRSQGWQPGEYLGAKDAPHSEFHTAANASYIKVALKDDMKGLGFKKSKEDEITGLDVFSDVLSRLNGKSEAAIEQDQLARLVVKTSAYIENRWGPMRFVRGGLLVGDKLKETTDDGEAAEEDEGSSTPLEQPADQLKAEKKKDKKSKKRKAESLNEEETTDAEATAEVESWQDKKRRREERKARKSKSEPATEGSASEEDDAKAKKRAKKEKKEKREKKRQRDADEAAEPASTEDDESGERAKKRKKSSKDASEDEVKKSKKDKKDKKEKKEKKRRKKEAAEASESESTSAPTAGSTGVSTPVVTTISTGTSTPQGSRNYVRSRFIAQKKAAVLDTKLLNQIFMVKA